MKKIILDCDPGMDDSMAIIMACKSSEIDLLAITTLNGNYSADITSSNALKTLEMLCRTDIPVAKGMDRPLCRTPPSDPFTHGADGQAEANLATPVTSLSIKHGVDMMIDTVMAHPGEVTVVATGPLTNLAMAILKCPDLVSNIAGVVAISGMFGLNRHAFANATGDTPQSEWNVYVDPEAAEIVYNSGISFTALGLDVATHFDVDFSEYQLEMLRNSSRKEAWFLHNAIQFVRSRGFGAYCAVIDCLAVAFVIDPSLVKVFKGRVGVETKNGLTLGMTVLDSRHHHMWNHLAEINIAKSVDTAAFLNLLTQLVLQE